MMWIFISGLHVLFQGLPGIRGEKGESGVKGFEVWGINGNVILELVERQNWEPWGLLFFLS